MINQGPFFESFSSLPDPRKDINKKHLMIDMLFITLCAVISGVRSWEDIEEFAIDREEWLRKYISLPYGIPSHDAIRYLFMFLDEKAFNKAFSEWVSTISPLIEGSHIAIDGKTNRRSGNKDKTLKPLHTVTAWATDTSLALGHIHVEEKTNEITAIPDLLDIIEVKGCLVTIDAMGCQRAITDKISEEKKGDYVIALKGNQKYLFEEVTEYFDDALENNFKDFDYVCFKETEKDHGRIESRSYYITSDIDDLFEVKDWKTIKTIAMVVAKRKIKGNVSEEKRYYISSCKNEPEKVKNAIRKHWKIENSLHWSLDISFNEDQCRKRVKNSAKNISTVRKMALTMLKTEETFKASINAKMLKACRKTEYLEKVLNI